MPDSYVTPESHGQDVRPEGSSSSTQSISDAPEGYRPQDSFIPDNAAPEVTVEPQIPDETPPAPPEKKIPETIPYDRFQEVVHEKNELKKWRDEFAQSYQQLPPELRLILEDPTVRQDKSRIAQLLGLSQEPQKPTEPDFDAIEDPYEREIARSNHLLRAELGQTKAALAKELDEMKSWKAQSENMALIQEGQRLLEQDERLIKSRKEFSGISDAEGKIVLDDARRLSIKYGGIPLSEAYKLTPHFERLMTQNIERERETKRTKSSSSIPSGVGMTVPPQARSLYAAFEQAWPKE